MRAGNLRHRVIVQRWTKTGTRPTGGATGDWQTHVANVPAEVIQLSGRELEYAKANVQTATHSIRVRWMEDITESDRIKYGEDIFNIGTIDNVNYRNVELVLTCTKEAISASGS